ncbi:MAG: hypothetical protein L0Y54_00345 [Sporichthyaceae bacterium]|nr:hypothetical protein [Sporichthyaceae bacterium]
MSDETFTLLAVITLLAALVASVLMVRAAHRHRALRRRFGPEYDRVLAESGGRRSGLAELRGRLRRHAQVDLKPLAPAEHSEFARRWSGTQEGFVEDPAAAVAAAGPLLIELMRARGYSVADSQRQRLADLSVEHGHTLDRYRAAHAISARLNASTEDLRLAMVDYRALFLELLGEPDESTVPTQGDGRTQGDGPTQGDG